MKRQNKKGFTIVELVIVIAVIAILSAVLIPTFSSIVRKAKISSDTQLVRNLNTALTTDEAFNGKPDTMFDALQVVEEAGYNVAKINASATDNEILWDSMNNVFCYLNEGAIQYIPDSNVTQPANVYLWQISDSVVDNYSTYYVGADVAELTAKDGLGLDVGTANVDKIVYNSQSSNTVIFRTNGGDLQVTAPNADVYHYGEAGFIEIIKVKGSSFHAFGKVEYVEIHEGRFVAEATAEIKVLAATATAVVVDEQNVIEVAHEDVENFEEIHKGATLFAGGKGVVSDPYLIETVEDFKNISTVYAEGYKYFKVKDGVSEIDAKDLSAIELNGSFDGNGVTFKNANGYIFMKVGTGNAEDARQVVVENFSVVFVAGTGVIKNCAAVDLKISNVDVVGYLVCYWNGAAFVSYGTRNGHSTGFDYTISFENCSSSAEIYSTNNAFNAILVGHPYPGVGLATINVDAETDRNIENTKLYYTGTGEAYGNKYYCATSNAKVYVDGVETTNNRITKNVVAVDAAKKPSKADSGEYVLTTEADTTKVVITLGFQYTLYTDNTYSESVPGSNGVGGKMGEDIVMDVVGSEEIEVLSKIESFEIVTGADESGYKLEDGKITIYMVTENENVDGWVTINVEQYTSGSNIAKYKGTLRLVEKITNNNPSADWIIK